MVAVWNAPQGPREDSHESAHGDSTKHTTFEASSGNNLAMKQITSTNKNSIARLFLRWFQGFPKPFKSRRPNSVSLLRLTSARITLCYFVLKTLVNPFSGFAWGFGIENGGRLIKLQSSAFDKETQHHKSSRNQGAPKERRRGRAEKRLSKRLFLESPFLLCPLKVCS